LKSIQRFVQLFELLRTFGNELELDSHMVSSRDRVSLVYEPGCHIHSREGDPPMVSSNPMKNLEEVAVDEGTGFGACLRDHGCVDQDQREDDHDDAGSPGDDIEAP